MADHSIDIIQLTADIVLKESSGKWTPYQPLLRTTNFTLRTACTPKCNVEEFKMLDFGFLKGLVLLDVNVTVSFIDMAIAKFRKASGLGMDLFLGKEGSVAFFDNLIGYRLSCAPNPTGTVKMFQNNTLTVSRPASPSVELLDSFCWRGTCFPNSVHYNDYATKIAPTSANGEQTLSVYGRDAGYAYLKTNVTRVCVSYWPVECLQSMDADGCNMFYSDKIVTQMGSSPAASNVVAIAVPVAVGAAVVVAALAALLVWRQRRRQSLATKQLGDLAAFKDVEPGAGRNSCGGSDGTNGVLSAINLANGPALLSEQQAGWHLLACHTSTAVGPVGPTDDTIQLGVLLGAGSSGRVYRARWRNRDVAVKVMQHDADTATLVTNECDLMMAFSHPNIVSAYHIVSWRKAASRAASNAAAAAAQPSTAHAGGAKDAKNSIKEAPALVPDVQGAGSARQSLDVNRNMEPNMQAGRATRQSLDVGRGGQQGFYQEPSNGHLFVTIQQGAEHNSGDCHGGAAAASAGLSAGSAQHCITSQTIATNGLFTGDSGSCHGLGDTMAQTWLILEFCDCGNLADAVRAGREKGADGKLSMAKTLRRLHDVACGMRYLHARNVLHRDLKACNILLVTDPDAPFGSRAKVADFGLSCAMRPGQTHHSTRTLGTVSHMAPELLRAGKQSPAADVYAYGICMWELATGRSAFGNAHYGAVFERVAIAGERPPVEPATKSALGPGYMMLMEACWAADPSLRPTFEQICEALELLMQEHSAGDDSAYGDGTAAQRLTAITNSLSRHWNTMTMPTSTAGPQQQQQQPEQRSFDGFL